MTNISENLRFPRAKSAQPDFKSMSLDEQLDFQVMGNERERYQLASSPYAERAVLHIMGCQDTCEDVRVAVANNQSTSPTTLNRMALEKTSETVQYAVASNRNTPLAGLTALSGRGRPVDVRLACADNPNASEEMQREVYRECRGSW